MYSYMEHSKIAKWRASKIMFDWMITFESESSSHGDVSDHRTANIGPLD